MVSWLKSNLAAGFAAAVGTAALFWWGTGLDPWWPLLWFAPVPVLLFAQQAKIGPVVLCAALGWALGALNLAGYFHQTLGFPIAALTASLLAPALAFAGSVLVFRTLTRRGLFGWAAVSFPALWAWSLRIKRIICVWPNRAVQRSSNGSHIARRCWT